METISETVLNDYVEIIKAVIVPTIATTPEEIEAIKRAAIKQYNYETEIKNNFDGQSIPDNVSSFRIGNFAMSFNKSSKSSCSIKGLAPIAYAILLNAGLLYRGVK